MFTRMKKFIACFCILFIGAVAYFHQTLSREVLDVYHSFVVYAAVPEQIPLKLHTLDDQGNPILDSYTYTYHLTAVDNQKHTQQITYERSGETVIPLAPKTYIRAFILFGHLIGTPKPIELSKVPTTILAQLELNQLQHQQHLKWTANNP